MNQNSVEMSQKCSILIHIAKQFRGVAKDDLTLLESNIADVLVDEGYLVIKHVPVHNIGDNKTYFYGEYETT